jgi:Leucine-rich repeat (LRR) protein
LQAPQWSALSEASGQIAQLDLARLGLNDEQIAPLGNFKALVRLNLSENALSDAGVRQLASLQSLESLNLYGNSAVTDASLDLLSNLASLRQLYAWDTLITPAAAKKLNVAGGRAIVVNLGTDVLSGKRR